MRQEWATSFSIAGRNDEKRLIRLLILAAAVLNITIGCSSMDMFMRVGDRQEIAFARLIEEIKGHRLIFIGEEL